MYSAYWKKRKAKGGSGVTSLKGCVKGAQQIEGRMRRPRILGEKEQKGRKEGTITRKNRNPKELE